MQKNIKWDTIVWIIIAVFIISIILLWILSIINFDTDMSNNYNIEIDKFWLKSNAENIVKKLDISNISDNENFYIYKDIENKEYKIMTWSINQDYKYINFLWNKVDKDYNLWKNYTREYKKVFDILRHILEPEKIDDLVFHFDANNIDWTNNSTISDWQIISEWKDLSENNIIAYQNSSWKYPKYKEDSISWLPVINFEWNDFFYIDDNPLINTDNTGWSWASWIKYPERSLAIVLRTWWDVTTNQMIYEEWWVDRWYSFMVHEWDIYAWVWNENEWVNWHRYKSVNLWEAIPNQVYFIMVVQTSKSTNDNTLEIFLNWELASKQKHVEPQVEHPNDIWIWAVVVNTVYPFEPFLNKVLNEWDYFTWWIWELISWNHSLTKNEVRWVQNYFNEKWLWWKQNIEYDIIESEIKKYNF